ncbi:pyridoxamine 5'-phosphate oxidase family protein [Streptacidiphilus jiangxiensis]|uniref:Nitroimidazol reductase NimA, pyridoxamine 5'-phosphate oxidase superfamily n=1 Tax=Streptacidiphilus jiangxiensis TaxID=235985 RepID=A0A1H7NEE6_STRJI|nr:pyridoxamine 5'-phosphate oxidase family protein [Streptacidiphilus jiangxiensis]SEL21870.1 Nitroimidazol reductase NimA, pyridoxamine 5'-phosphate oxidase superfamily [Streptacidiphilus jiangxiensis]
MTDTPPRPLEQRIADTRARFAADMDVWVATGGAAGPHLVPLSYDWDGASFVVSTLPGSATARNIAENGQVRLAFGPTRDVVMVEGTARPVPAAEVDGGVADAYAAHTDWDPRKQREEYAWFRITPLRIQAWREADELRGRDLMKQGAWLAG